jgi:hypothetical protein
MHGSHLAKAYSRTQSNIALSSGEAEFYALVATASEALGIVAMTKDFGDEVEAYLYADASAAIGVAGREGLGRIRHLDTQSLWLQQALRKRRLGLGKVLGTENPSDLMTKHVDSKLLGEHVRSMGCEFAAGRAELAPQVVQEIEDRVEEEDVANYIEDALGGLMTTPMEQQSAIPEIHCAGRSEVCLVGLNKSTADLFNSGLVSVPEKLMSRRLVDDNCRDGDEAREGSINRQRGRNCFDQDCRKSGRKSRTSEDERLRGHPHFYFDLTFGQCLPFGQSRSRGGACFCAVCPRRLSVFTSKRRLHLCARRVRSFSGFP